MRAHTSNNLLQVCLVSHSIAETVIWSFYALLFSVVIIATQAADEDNNVVSCILAGSLIGYFVGLFYLRIVVFVVQLFPGTDATIAVFSRTLSLGDNGLWKELLQWKRTVFAATSKELKSILQQHQLKDWTEMKLLRKVSDKSLRHITTKEEAEKFTYGSERFIHRVWVLDQDKMLDLAERTVLSYK